MNKRSLTVSRILGGLAVLLAIGFTALRTYMMLTAYDVENGFYTNDVLRGVLRYTLIAFAVIAFALGHIYIKEGKIADPLPESKGLKFVSMFVGCVLGGFLLYTIGKSLLPMFADPGIADLVMAALAVIAMLYYFSFGKKGDFRSLLCLASALVLLAMVFGLYFNKHISYVNHSVILAYAAAIFTMLAFTAEANFFLKKSAYKRYLSYAPVAIVLSFVLAIPDILFGILRGAAAISDIYYDVLLLAFGIYHSARLAVLILQPAKEA